ncbi:MAG: hypothetical protein LBG76_09725 [Treponema sp.]|jgi:hypothetical protein|nr:hypothetical protein [Treponema sp.]
MKRDTLRGRGAPQFLVPLFLAAVFLFSGCPDEVTVEQEAVKNVKVEMHNGYNLVSWDKAQATKGAAYAVYRQTVDKEDDVKTWITTNLHYADTSVENGKVYQYDVLVKGDNAVAFDSRKLGNWKSAAENDSKAKNTIEEAVATIGFSSFTVVLKEKEAGNDFTTDDSIEDLQIIASKLPTLLGVYRFELKVKKEDETPYTTVSAKDLKPLDALGSYEEWKIIDGITNYKQWTQFSAGSSLDMQVSVTYTPPHGYFASAAPAEEGTTDEGDGVFINALTIIPATGKKK